LSTRTILEQFNNKYSGKAAIPIHARDGYQTGILQLVQNKNAYNNICNYVKRPLSAYFDMLSFRTPVAHKKWTFEKRLSDGGLVRFWDNLD